MSKKVNTIELQTKTLPQNTQLRGMMVTISTGSIANAGTNANVRLLVGGKRFIMDKYDYDDFERGNTDSYYFNINMTLEELRTSQIMLRHDNSGKKPGWYVSNVLLQVRALRSNYYAVYKTWGNIGWLAKDEQPHYTTEALLQEGYETEE